MKPHFAYHRHFLFFVYFISSSVLAGGAFQSSKNGCRIWNPDAQPNESVEFEGSCEKGYAQGLGIAKWFIGDRLTEVWEGSFSAGWLAGVAVVSSQMGQYIGQYSQGKRSGQGRWFDADGNQYQGEFKNDLADGRGFSRAKSGETYQGDFRHGKRHGYGEYISVSGWRYQGDFLNDLITGVGTMYLSTGEKYIGNFKNGKFHGDGFMYDSQGKIIGEGVFSEGKFVRLSDVYLNLTRHVSPPVVQVPTFEIPMAGNVNGQQRSLTPSVLGGGNWVNVITPSGKVLNGYMWDTKQPGMLGGSTYIQIGR